MLLKLSRRCRIIHILTLHSSVFWNAEEWRLTVIATDNKQYHWQLLLPYILFCQEILQTPLLELDGPLDYTTHASYLQDKSSHILGGCSTAMGTLNICQGLGLSRMRIHLVETMDIRDYIVHLFKIPLMADGGGIEFRWEHGGKKLENFTLLLCKLHSAQLLFASILGHQEEGCVIHIKNTIWSIKIIPILLPLSIHLQQLFIYLN